jgi:hypothetical protein
VIAPKTNRTLDSRHPNTEIYKENVRRISTDTVLNEDKENLQPCEIQACTRSLQDEATNYSGAQSDYSTAILPEDIRKQLRAMHRKETCVGRASKQEEKRKPKTASREKRGPELQAESDKSRDSIISARNQAKMKRVRTA